MMHACLGKTRAHECQSDSAVSSLFHDHGASLGCISYISSRASGLCVGVAQMPAPSGDRTALLNNVYYFISHVAAGDLLWPSLRSVVPHLAVITVSGSMSVVGTPVSVVVAGHSLSYSCHDKHDT